MNSYQLSATIVNNFLQICVALEVFKVIGIAEKLADLELNKNVCLVFQIYNLNRFSKSYLVFFIVGDLMNSDKTRIYRILKNDLNCFTYKDAF